MTQVMIDTKACSKAELLQAIAFLTGLAALKTDAAPAAVAAVLEVPGASGTQDFAAPPAVAGDLPDGVADAAAAFGGNPDTTAAPPPPAPGAVPPPPPVVPPAPPAAAPAAAATTAAPPAPTSVAELDKNGIPWDARIHAETKSKNKDGSWRNKRGVADELLAAVTAELKARTPAAAPVATAGAVPPPPAAAASPAVPPAPAAVPAAPPVTAGAVPPPPPPAAGQPAGVLPGNGAQPVTFATLMAKITAAMNAQKLTMPQVNEALNANGYANLAALSGDSSRLAAVDAHLQRWGI